MVQLQLHLLIFEENKNCTNQFWGLLGMKPQNIPKLFSGIFGDKTPKNPNFQTNPVPKISPNYFWGFSGIKPQKTPIFNPTPSPKNPQCFFIPCPHPRSVPNNSGTGRGKPGIGAPFPTTNLYYLLIHIKRTIY